MDPIGDLMTVSESLTKGRSSELKERSAAQEHFIDLCWLLGRSRPRQRRCRTSLTSTRERISRVDGAILLILSKPPAMHVHAAQEVSHLPLRN